MIVEILKTGKQLQEKKSKGDSQKAILALTGSLSELSHLNSIAQDLRRRLNTSICEQDAILLMTLSDQLKDFFRDIVRHQRVAATHIFVFMISPEERQQKPYAIPIQCLPVKGIPHSTLRQLVDCIVNEMHIRGMDVAG